MQMEAFNRRWQCCRWRPVPSSSLHGPGGTHAGVPSASGSPGEVFAAGSGEAVGEAVAEWVSKPQREANGMLQREVIPINVHVHV